MTDADLKISIRDNVFEEKFRQDIWNYLMQQTWGSCYRPNMNTKLFVPETDGLEYPTSQASYEHGMLMPRALLGVDEKYLKAKHRIIYNLWERINAQFNNQYEITGLPEGMDIDRDYPEWVAKSAIPGLTAGWRVYASAMPVEKVKRSHGVHRDSRFLDDDSYVTILYVANMKWYPTWFAECIFYSETDDTSDHQQFQKTTGISQSRNFNVGWPRQIVSPIPGRIICYDSRTLHTTRPSSEWAEESRVVIAFRAKRKQ
jgi:hypothetical protein